MTRDGLVAGMSADEYHGGDELSFHGILPIRHTPAHFEAARQSDDTPTDAMMFGQAYHSRILELETPLSRHGDDPDQT